MSSWNGYTEILPFRHGKANQFLALKKDCYIAATVREYGEYSEAEVDVFRRFIRHDDICIDAGALFGEHTLAMAELCPRGAVLAFEPQRIPFQILCGNMQLNSIDNVDASKSALGEGDAVSSVLPFEPRLIAPWGLQTLAPPGENREPIRVRSIDSLMLSRLDFVKLDVEGFEAAIIRGAVETIARTLPVLYLEFNSNRPELLALLTSLGYSAFRHFAPVDRDPNYLGKRLSETRVTRMVPSDMVLAVPGRRSEYITSAWLSENGFHLNFEMERPGV
jgi:FkbM family methyltransferase